jgi:ubiquinone biosynthesis protein UbiJ
MMPPALDPSAIPGAIANRVLEREAWARQRLAAHAGRTFVISSGPAASAFAIDESGRVFSALPSASTADLTLRLSPLDMPAFLADPTRWDRYVKADGDLALAATLKELAPTMPWLIEQAFASVLGAIVSASPTSGVGCSRSLNMWRNVSVTASRLRASDPDCCHLHRRRKPRVHGRWAACVTRRCIWRRASMRSPAGADFVAAANSKEKEAPPQTR